MLDDTYRAAVRRDNWLKLWFAIYFGGQFGEIGIIAKLVLVLELCITRESVEQLPVERSFNGHQRNTVV